MASRKTPAPSAQPAAAKPAPASLAPAPAAQRPKTAAAQRPKAPATQRPKTAAAKTPVARPRAAKAPATQPAAVTLKPANAADAKPGKAKKPPKLRPVLVRDGFTMPESDFALIGTLKARALAGGRETKKSELLRAGLQALSAMDSVALRAALDALEPVKTGRPKTDR